MSTSRRIVGLGGGSGLVSRVCLCARITGLRGIKLYVSSGFGYRYSNYATYARLTEDHLTEWHPAFLRLGRTLDECAYRYRAFCRRCRIQTKAGGRRSLWAQNWLPDVRSKRGKSQDRQVTGQMLIWERCQVQGSFLLPLEVLEVAEEFTRANFAWP